MTSLRFRKQIDCHLLHSYLNTPIAEKKSAHLRCELDVIKELQVTVKLKESFRSRNVVWGDLFQQKALLITSVRTKRKVSYAPQLPLKEGVLVHSDFTTTFFNL